jgi:hypothetical protein
VVDSPCAIAAAPAYIQRNIMREFGSHYLIVVNTSTVSAIQAKNRGGKAGKVLEA